MGICAPGNSRPAVLIRVYSAFLMAGQALFNTFGQVVDPYMSVVGYFNSLRELGGMRRLAEDDVKTRSFRVEMSMVERPGLAQRSMQGDIRELTSRVSSQDIGRSLDELEFPFVAEWDDEKAVRDSRVQHLSYIFEETGESTEFKVNARGAMQVAVVVEEMRREGFEVLVSRPTVIKKEIDGRSHEPFETLYLEVPDEAVGGCMQSLANRKGVVESISANRGRTQLEATVPTRGLIGFEFELLNLTSGEGIMSHLFKEYRPDSGDIRTRRSGTLVSMEKGESMTYALRNIETRGKLFVGAGEEVYEGMIVGENPRTEDLPVNPTKAKHVTNHRAAGSDKTESLTPAIKFSLERAIEYIAPDELVEVTPKSIRLRKRILDFTERKRDAKRASS